ncbi:hypothetical protein CAUPRSCDRAFT_12137 [Caulochytrium protostelioides]|nr:hypothetical protein CAUPRSCDRAFT_12137 [Caulochytrium protostelioides]
MQTLSNYAWGITESHGTSIYEAWSQLQKEDLENLQKTADRDAAQSGAQAPVVTAPEVAEESGSTPASEEAELLHKILRHIRLDTVVTPTPAMLEDPNGDFLEFYDALLAVYTHLYQTSPISISDPINNAHEAFNEVWKLEEFKPIVEDLDMGQLEQIMEEKLRNLDEAARKFLPSDFRSSKPEDGDGRFPLLPSKIFGQVMDLFQFVDGVAQLWQQATTPSQILTFFSNADVYRQTMNVSHRLGQYRVLNQYLRLSSQNN